MFMYEYRCLQESGEGVGLLGARVPSRWELHNVNAGN